MDFTLSEEHLMIRDAAREFAQTELLPGVIERDNLQQFPAEQVKKMGEMEKWCMLHGTLLHAPYSILHAAFLIPFL